MGKGDRRERELCDLYQQAGMAVYRPATVQYGENDVFGLFDVLAVSPSHGQPHAVQVKSNRASGIEGWKRHTRLFRRVGFRTFYAVPVDNEGWRLIECWEPTWDHEPRHGTVVDERKMTTVQMGEGIFEWLESQKVEA